MIRSSNLDWGCWGWSGCDRSVIDSALVLAGDWMGGGCLAASEAVEAASLASVLDVVMRKLSKMSNKSYAAQWSRFEIFESENVAYSLFFVKIMKINGGHRIFVDCAHYLKQK